MKFDRRIEVLRAIVEQFINTAEPVGSNAVLVSYNFSVSPATIRNDMMQLEKEGLIFQPHTSSGRVPTDLGYRLFVDEIIDYSEAKELAKKELEKMIKVNEMIKFKEKIYDVVSLVSQVTKNAGFATLPDSPRTFYLGFSNIIKQPEFLHDTIRASQVIEVFEHNDGFVNLLKGLEVDDSVKIFIGKENVIPQIQSCSLLVTKLRVGEHENVIGLLGPTRMDYAFNKAVLDEVKSMI